MLYGVTARPSPNIGVLKVYANGSWGTVCYDYFGVDEANAACRGLGFAGLMSLTPVKYQPCRMSCEKIYSQLKLAYYVNSDCP